jgi:putative nucleotidyltransferase with HDIG domain
VSKPSHIITKPHHLAARFFGSLSNTPASPADVEWARSQLKPGEWALWQQMSNQDQRHSVTVARRFVGVRPDSTRAEIAGALLHDVGKIECGLGTWGRVAATVVGRRGRRFTQYHDHEQIGADLAEAAGSEPETVDIIAERGPVFPIMHACDRA